MPISVEQLQATGRLVSRDHEGGDLRGRWRVNPPLEVIAEEDGHVGDVIVIKKGQQYSISMWDEASKYAGHVHLHPTASHWWPLNMFSIKT